MAVPDLAVDVERVVETHSSWVFLTRDRAYKVKKPVTLAFLDFGTLQLRHDACRREVELNRRLAPGVYTGVRALVRGPDGRLHVASAKTAAAVEYAVEMVRFDEGDTLEARVVRGAAGTAELRAVGAWLARFHARAETAPGGAEPVMRSLDDTFATLLALGRPQPALQRFSAAFVASAAPAMDARAAAGRVRDGHGDLRAEHVLLHPDGPLAVDCIEFSDALRRVDAGADLSFLVMDLERLGRPDLGRELVEGYRAAGGDPGDPRLLMFHAMARALVRVKVALLPGGAGPEAAEGLLSLAGRLAWRARGPLILAVAGLAASGKTTLAGALAQRYGLAHLEADAVRDELCGGRRRYDAAHDDATYAELLRRAVAERDGAIVAATFRHARHRRALCEEAARAGTPLLLIECLVPEAGLRRRAAARAADGGDLSEAGPDVVERQLRERERYEDLPPDVHLPLRADRPAEALVAAVEDALDRLQDVAPLERGGAGGGQQQPDRQQAADVGGIEPVADR